MKMRAFVTIYVSINFMDIYEKQSEQRGQRGTDI